MLKNILHEFKKRNGNFHDENQYLNLIDDILNEGSIENGRNGNTITVFGCSMHFDLTDNTLPLLTTKKVGFKTVLRELLWFISGKTDNKILQNKNVKIWNENASRDFLDSRGLYNLKENDLGPVYGHQWRYFNAKYKDCNTDYKGEGYDQLEYIISNLKNSESRNSRRLVLSSWNPCQINEMALPPCHVLLQFTVLENKYLHSSLYQRSGDVGLGVPFNIASYSILTHLIAHHCNLIAKSFIYNLGNTHIYDDHIEALKIQKERIPYVFPKINIKNKYEDINDYLEEDFELINYNYHNIIEMKMRK